MHPTPNPSSTPPRFINFPITPALTYAPFGRPSARKGGGVAPEDVAHQALCVGVHVLWCVCDVWMGVSLDSQ